MYKKIILVSGIVLFGIALLAFSSTVLGANSHATVAGSTWQMGPSLDTEMLGCPAGNGLARFTGIYYPAQDKVYFIGGRCEDNVTTTGEVFYFDPVTRSYNITQVVLDTPVSNYQMVQIDDDGRGHGPGFYIVGGRTISGTQTSAVQVFYPDANLAETITTDPFPPIVPYTPGGVVSYDDKILAFGGFDGINMYAQTYTYDPLQAAGSRWTLTPCDLPTPRSYISTAVVGNLIFAIGGDELPSGSLTPITDTVVVDLVHTESCWQDDLMADLPEANGDATAVYVGENYLSGGIYMIGGIFSIPNRWVFRYDLATDTWSTFPDLVIPDPATGLRNEAAMYIPASSDAIGAGIPGLWTFGGYDGTSGGNGMTETSEYFENPPTLTISFFLPWVNK